MYTWLLDMDFIIFFMTENVYCKSEYEVTVAIFYVMQKKTPPFLDIFVFIPNQFI